MVSGMLLILFATGMIWYEFHDRLPTDREVTAMLSGIPFGILVFLGAIYETRWRRSASSRHQKSTGWFRQPVSKTTAIIIGVFLIGVILGEQQGNRI